jgi:hypothetical protein
VERGVEQGIERCGMSPTLKTSNLVLPGVGERPYGEPCLVHKPGAAGTLDMRYEGETSGLLCKKRGSTRVANV